MITSTLSRICHRLPALQPAVPFQHVTNSGSKRTSITRSIYNSLTREPSIYPFREFFLKRMENKQILKIIACIKQVPTRRRKSKPRENGQVTWGDAPLVINPFDEYAVEGALQQKEANGGTVTALCIGPESAREALKHALAMGADEAILVSDPALNEHRSRSARRASLRRRSKRSAARTWSCSDVRRSITGRAHHRADGTSPRAAAAWAGWADQGPGWKRHALNESSKRAGRPSARNCPLS
jgi:hypothetical protein